MNTVRKKVAVKLYDSIVKKTPVDTGRARGNWQISIGHDATETVNREDKKALGTVSAYKGEETGKLQNVKGDETIYISNNLPYIAKLEYGGYGDNSPSGKTENGFSKQAPNGMVGVTVANFKKHIDEAVRESGWKK